MLKIIEHIDAKLADLKDELLGVIREGRELHTKEHADQFGPVVTWYQQERRAAERRDARVRPLVRAAVWVTDHWIVSVAVVGGIVAALFRLGVLHS